MAEGHTGCGLSRLPAAVLARAWLVPFAAFSTGFDLAGFSAFAVAVFSAPVTARFGVFFEATLEAETRAFAGLLAFAFATAGAGSAGVSGSAISMPKTSASSPAARVFL